MSTHLVQLFQKRCTGRRTPKVHISEIVLQVYNFCYTCTQRCTGVVDTSRELYSWAPSGKLPPSSCPAMNVHHYRRCLLEGDHFYLPVYHLSQSRKCYCILTLCCFHVDIKYLLFRIIIGYWPPRKQLVTLSSTYFHSVPHTSWEIKFHEQSLVEHSNACAGIPKLPGITQN